MRRQPRPGLTLTEVLVAMFVMALGLMALATLFPLGALQVGQALKDDRTAQTAMLADGWLRVYWRDAARAYDGNPSALPAEHALAALDDPNVLTIASAGGATTFTVPTAGAAPALLPAGSSLNTNTTAPANLGLVLPADMSLVGARVTNTLSGSTTQRQVQPLARPLTQAASYPVLLDPLGTLARGGTAAVGFERYWVGRAGAPGTGGAVFGSATLPLLLPRRNTLATAGSTAAFAACSLSDDLTYQANGGAGQTTTDPSTGAATPQPLGRQGRYTWAALIQRPDNSQPQRAKLKVLVFDGRPINFAAAGDEAVLTNDTSASPSPLAYHAIAADGRSMTLNVPTRGADQAPLVRRGGWVVIARLDSAPAGVRAVTVHRITGLTTGDEITLAQYLGSSTQVPVTPVALDVDPPVPAASNAATTQVILLAGLSEVFDRPDLDAGN